MTVNQVKAKEIPPHLENPSSKSCSSVALSGQIHWVGGETKLSLPACLPMLPEVTLLEAGWVGEDTRQQSIFIYILSLASLHSPLWWWWWWALLPWQVCLASMAQEAALAWDVTHSCGETWWCDPSQGKLWVASD